MVVFAADSYYGGPSTTVVTVGDDQDVRYAETRIMTELSRFIRDDPFIKQRLVLVDNPCFEVLSALGGIVICISHGTPEGLATGSTVIPWADVAAKISQSPARIHMFAACHSSQVAEFSSSRAVLGFYGPIDVDVAISIIVSRELSLLEGPEAGFRYFWST